MWFVNLSKHRITPSDVSFTAIKVDVLVFIKNFLPSLLQSFFCTLKFVFESSDLFILRSFFWIIRSKIWSFFAFPRLRILLCTWITSWVFSLVMLKQISLWYYSKLDSLGTIINKTQKRCFFKNPNYWLLIIMLFRVRISDSLKDPLAFSLAFVLSAYKLIDLVLDHRLLSWEAIDSR